MSHTTAIEGVSFSDIEALKLAVKELNTAGVKCSLEKGGTPRAYYSNQQGLGPAAYVLRLQGAPYDVGFYKDEKGMSYTARTDFWGGHVACQLGAKARDESEKTMAQLGKLNSLYAAHATVRQAVKQGMQPRRINNADGSIRIVIGGIK